MKETRTSKPHTIHIRMSNSPDEIVEAPTPSTDFTPNVPATLLTNEESAIHVLVATIAKYRRAEGRKILQQQSLEH